jgi:hypothetical protein
MKYLLAVFVFLMPVLIQAQTATSIYVHPHVYLIKRAIYLKRDRDTIGRGDLLSSRMIKVDSGQLVVVRADMTDDHWAIISNYLASRQGPVLHPTLISPTDNLLTEFYVWRASLVIEPYIEPKSLIKSAREQALH